MNSPEAVPASDILKEQKQSRTIRGLAPWIVLALVSFALYFYGMGTWAFTDPGESYYTEAAREMVESGDWIVPHLNYQIYFSKPILTFWLIAASYKAFGMSEMAARLPFALLATMMIFATYAATRRLFNARTAFLAALIAASNPLTVVFAKTSPIDLAFCAFLNIAVLAFAMSVFTRSFPWACALWAALGLSVLTKGPAGIVFFVLGTALFLLLEKPPLKKLWSWFLSTRPLLGIVIFAAITVPWYWAVWKATKGLFLEVFIKYENIARLAGKTNIHKSRWYFFLPVLAYGFAPWSLILAQTIKVTFGEVLAERWFGSGRLHFKSTYRPYMKSLEERSPVLESMEDNEKAKAKEKEKQERDELKKPLPQPEIERLTIYYLSSWSLAIFIFFTLSKTQLDTYIQPILTPLAVLTAVAIVRLVESQNSEDKKLADMLKFDAQWIKIFAYLCALASGLAAAACFLTTIMPFLPIYVWQRLLIFPAGIFCVIGAAAQFKALKKGDVIRSLIAQALTLSALTGCILPVAFQVSGQRRQNHMVALANNLKGNKDEIALFGTYMPSAMYYMERPVDYLSSVAQFTAAKKPIPLDGLSYGPTISGRRQLILGDDKHMQAFQSRPDLKLEKLASDGDWSLYELTNGYAEKPRRLEETFRYLMAAKHSFSDTDSYGPLTVPLGGGDADWFKYKLNKRQP